MDYRQLAYQKAIKYGLDPDMFLRQIQQESGFNPNAVSSAGAIGLGQLMPATAKELGVDPNDPDQNLEGAARYMRQQMDRFGRPDLALAAYNAGPSRVAKLGRVPDITETQNYVAKIMEANPAMRLSTKDAQMTPTQPKTLWERLTTQSETTGLNPLQSFAAALDPLIMPEMRGGAAIREMGAQRLTTGAKNRTIEMLRSKANAGDTIAAQVLSALDGGAIDAKTAMSLYLGKQFETPKDDRTAQIKNYEYWISKGKTPQEAEALVKSGQTIQIGGPAGAEDKFFEEKYKNLGKEFSAVQKQAGQAGANNLTINALKQLYQVAPNGPITGRLLELFPEATDVSAAVQSLRTQLAPQLRVEGSGSTSDIEYAGMLNSLGSLKNSPQANAALLDLMLVKNELIQRKAEIASKVGMPPEQGGMTINEAEVAMLDIDRKMWSDNAMVASIKQLIEKAGGFTASSDGNTITTSSGLTVQFE